LRRAEILQVGKAHMPTMDQLSALVERDEYWPVVVRRKGGRSHAARVPPDLILRTLDYVEYGRREIVETCLRNIVDYREPEAIFISSRTGKPLHPDSVTTIGRRAFRKAGIARANIHRLRARYAVRMVESQVEALCGDRIIGSESSWVETILVRTAESMGHTNPQSLRPYLTYVLNRRLQTAEGFTAERLSARLRQLELQEGTLLRRLKHQRGLQKVASQIKAGRDKAAASLLRKIADDIDERALRQETSAT
jgi:integrase